MLIMEGLAEGLSQLSRLLSGVISDISSKRKPTLLLGIILTTISKPIFILSGSMSAIMFSKILERVSNGVIATPRDAYVSDHAPATSKGVCFGLMMAFKTAGCVIGPILVAILLKYVTNDYRSILWIGILPCILSILLVLLFLDEKFKNILNHNETNDTPVKSSFSDILKDLRQLPTSYWCLLIVASLFMMARFSDGILQLRFNQAGASESFASATIAIFNLISVLCSLPIGWLSDKFGRKNLLYFSFLSLLLCHIFCAFSDSLIGILIGIIFWGMQRSTSQILFSASISDVAPKRIIGTAMGLFYICIGIVALLAGIISGKFIDRGTNDVIGAFKYGTVTAGIAFVVLILMNRPLRNYTLKEMPGTV
jgi:MFS family permease